MKKFNLKLITPLILTLILQGCMPDSLTKFKKEPPKKIAPASTSIGTPVVDPSGNIIPFTPPTMFYYYNISNATFNATVDKAISSELIPNIDGSLGNPNKRSNFAETCSLDLTGDTQTQTLPPGIELDSTGCVIGGTPVAIASVTTSFCSNSAYLTQTTCEAAPFTWNATTSKCSNPDYQYTTQAACIAAKNKWYKVGSQIPYRIIQTYHNELGVQDKISTTIHIGAYKKPIDLNFTQSDKILIGVTPLATGKITDISPVTTTAASVGAYSKANFISGETSASGIAKFVDVGLNKIGINKLVALYVNDITPFTQYGFIAVLGTCSNAIYVTRASCLGAFETWSDSGKVGKIASVDSTFGILYIENISSDNKYFSTDEKISSDANGYVEASYITEADDTYIFNDSNIDNDSQYYSANFTAGNKTSVYQTGSSYPIKAILPFGSDSLSAANGVIYKISPALPPGLLFDTASGMISGAFDSDLESTKFTITATNILGSISNSIYLASITAPSNYSVSNKQIITVSNTALFKEGEELYQPLTPPLTASRSATILKILNGYQIAIETHDSEFLEGASLDSGSRYNSQKAFIIPDDSCVATNYTTKDTCEDASYVWSGDPVYYNLALTLNSSGGYVVGDEITTTGVVAANTNGIGAKAIVASIYTDTVPAPDRDTLFVQVLTQDATGTSSVKTFFEGDTVNSGATIYQIDNSLMKLTLNLNTGFSAGADIVSSGNAGAYTYKLSGNVISVSDITKQPSGTLFKIGDTVYDHESQAISTNNTTLTAVTFDNLFVLERGKQSVLHGNIVAGNEVTYSIAPPLPSGLALNTATGKISGTPTVAVPRTDFLITATNFIGNVTYVTSIEVRDYFQLVDKSATHSFLLHKVGDTQTSRKCRINANDILNNSTSKALDIRCFLEGEEEDIHFNKIKFNAVAGPGVCEFVQYAPYYFQQYSAIQSVGTSPTNYPAIATIKVGCSSAGTVPTPDLCESNYSDDFRCDEGYLSYTEEIWSDPGTGCVLDSTSVKKVKCEGSKINCIAGPVTDILTATQLKVGHRSLIYNAVTGFDNTWTISAPMDKDDLTNLRVANGTIKNQCLASNTDVSTFEARSKLIPGITSPLGALGELASSPPTAGPYYVFNCLDAAMEIKARIRVVVRDWDRSFKIDSAIDNQDYTTPASLMNVAGSDPVFGGLYNFYSDWDDDYKGTGAADYLGGCGVIGAGTEYAFPGDNI